MIRSLFFLYKSKKTEFIVFLLIFTNLPSKINIFRRDIPIKNEEADSRKDL